MHWMVPLGMSQYGQTSSSKGDLELLRLYNKFNCRRSYSKLSLDSITYQTSSLLHSSPINFRTYSGRDLTHSSTFWQLLPQLVVGTVISRSCSSFYSFTTCPHCTSNSNSPFVIVSPLYPLNANVHPSRLFTSFTFILSQWSFSLNQWNV